ncbi:hypothetical protein EDD15DRAFT_1306987 [Pisolithus albus]|nr:hypothetical protein EDD15DRAFT_1306987 [Pisolithus albus]
MASKLVSIHRKMLPGSSLASCSACKSSADARNGSTSSQRGVLADDERVARLSGQELREKKDWRMLLILEVIMKWAHPSYFGVARACSGIQELWCRIIEGDTGEDYWLWVDGDEDWLRRRQPGEMLWRSANLGEIDWDSAQSALCRRISQQRYPPATGPHGSRNERVRNATHEQRFSAIVWLLSSSKGMAELTIQHGYTPPTFRVSKMTSVLSSLVGSCWDVFPVQTRAWEGALVNSKQGGCICLRSCRDSLRVWFDMLVWLDGIPPPLEGIDDESCIRCRSLVQSRYEDLANEGLAHPDFQLWNVMCYHAIRTTRRDNAELLAISSKRISKTGRQLVERTLNPAFKRGQIDVTFTPYINEYPRDLRFSAAEMSCILPSDTQLDTPWPVQIPDNVLGDAGDPWIMIGIVAWMCAYCRSGFEESIRNDRHDELWHSHYLDYASEFSEFIQMPGPLPQLSATGIELYHQLRGNKFEGETFLSQSGSERRQLCLIVYVAVAIFLRSRDVNLPGCPRCRVLLEKSSINGSSTPMTSEREPLPPSSTFPMDDASDIQADRPLSRLPGKNGMLFRSSPALKSTEDLINDEKQAADEFPSTQRSGFPTFDPTASQSEACPQEPAGMEAFTNITRDKALSKNEMRSQLAQQFHRLNQYVDSLGLDASTCLHGPDGNDMPHPESPMEKLPAGGVSNEPLSDPPRLTKSDMIQEIKDRLLEMLGEVDLPCERLPWYTLDKDLEKHGFVLVNWPAGVVRKRSNKGIYDLSTVDVNLLYQAIMHPDEACRLRICRRPSEFTAKPTLLISSSSKRPMQCSDSNVHPAKRTRFKDETMRLLTPSPT